VPNAGWFADPTGRHRVRYRDSNWTVWVADTGDAERDADGVTKIRRSRHRNFILAGIVGFLLAVLGLLAVAAISSYDQEVREQQQIYSARPGGFVREMDGWSLPPSVARSSKPDDQMVIGSSASATRYFVAQPGFTTVQATNDLVASLRAQGYDMSVLGDSWIFDCKSGCTGSIAIEGDSIQAWLTR
jgi:hypothetical protein